MKRAAGRYERVIAGGKGVASFAPFPLPPRDPVPNIGGEIDARRRAAERAPAGIEIAGETIVPSVGWFRYAFMRKGAAISPQIEGARAALADSPAFEAATGAALPGPPPRGRYGLSRRPAYSSRRRMRRAAASTIAATVSACCGRARSRTAAAAFNTA